MRINSLHKEIKQVEEGIREKTHYCRRLEHMLSRLKNNQVKQKKKNHNIQITALLNYMYAPPLLLNESYCVVVCYFFI